MAGTGKTILRKTSEKDICSFGFFPTKPEQFGATVTGSGKRKTDTHADKCTSAAYLKPPSLESIQTMISQAKDIRTPSRILSALDSVFPLKDFLAEWHDPSTLIPIVFRKWFESFIPIRVLEKISLSLQILPDGEIDCELFDIESKNDRIIQFGVETFFEEFSPLGIFLERYDKEHPGLAKFILRMLSVCPMNFGTPENIYETASMYCWNGEDNESEIFEERFSESLAGGDDEDEARDFATSTILVEYAEFESILPDWTFRRDQRQCDYQGTIPSEMKKMKFCYDRYMKLKKTNYLYPNVCYPGILVPLDQESFDFSCEVLNRIGNEQCQCGGSYCLSTLAWRLPLNERRGMQRVFREIKTILEYFGACAEFLLNCEKEDQNA